MTLKPITLPTISYGLQARGGGRLIPVRLRTGRCQKRIDVPAGAGQEKRQLYGSVEYRTTTVTVRNIQ